MGKARRNFDLGERVRVWYRSARKWKVATVRAWIFVPGGHSLVADYYQVRCNGTDNRRYYRADELRPVK